MRIHKHDARVKAFVYLNEQEALRRAHEADAGADSRPELTAFPFAVKDVIDVKGVPTRGASRITPNGPASNSAPIVKMLERAGAIFVGKTNTHEFAYGAVTPPTRNPHDLSRIPGGSSGGSAAAVAAGFVRAAVGTDTGGSIRLPAALCGVYAIRPTRRADNFSGAIPLSPTYDAMGIIASNLPDLQRISSVVFSTGAQTAFVPRSAKDLTFGVPAADDVDASVGRELDAAIHLCPNVRTLSLPPMKAWFEPRMIIQMREALDVHRAAGWWPEQADRYTPETRRSLTLAESISQSDLARARKTLRALDGAIMGALDSADVILTPTVPVVAPSAQELQAMPSTSSSRHPIVSKLGLYTLPFSTAALASVTVPLGYGSGRLPVGLQLVAASEGTVLKAAELFQLQPC